MRSMMIAIAAATSNVAEAGPLEMTYSRVGELGVTALLADASANPVGPGTAKWDGFDWNPLLIPIVWQETTSRTAYCGLFVTPRLAGGDVYTMSCKDLRAGGGWVTIDPPRGFEFDLTSRFVLGEDNGRVILDAVLPTPTGGNVWWVFSQGSWRRVNITLPDVQDVELGGRANRVCAAWSDPVQSTATLACDWWNTARLAGLAPTLVTIPAPEIDWLAGVTVTSDYAVVHWYTGGVTWLPPTDSLAVFTDGSWINGPEGVPITAGDHEVFQDLDGDLRVWTPNQDVSIGSWSDLGNPTIGEYFNRIYGVTRDPLTGALGSLQLIY